MAFSKKQISDIYHKRAKSYDLTANLYYLIGVREYAFRKKAVKASNLNPGNTVVEIGCGTGLNFSLLRRCIGIQGRIIGVDLTEAMLAEARQRVLRNGWANIDLIQCDAASFKFPEHVDGVISTFALTLVPEYDRVIQNSALALPPGKRFVTLDFKKPDRWPDWLIRLYVMFSKPFGVTLDLADRHPWESIRSHMDLIEFSELYFGAMYICIGTSKQARRKYKGIGGKDVREKTTY